ncbi:MAG: dTMP kinase [Lactobacillus sp.]|jgi:dTMP kinase|nr:dTMP kinase [Lactobacillus sp.]MCH3905949.1 dTMP kinase [Lactobacillus sp.]MCH3990477.1 dTMP kinase [Lactobacillus sp.]MCH4068808.1 dTMP kinase [Lactobacillus sp.]MCI1304433.1 dTMP kinase [Lactobacillus sp.]
MTGYFVTFEGPDGSGKTTALQGILEKLPVAAKRSLLVTREPGGSVVAEKIRKLILDPVNTTMTDRTEALLYAAQRSQHVTEVLKPALAADKVVFSDRFVDSSLAYQGAGRQLGIAAVKEINDFATQGLAPDLTILFCIEPAQGLARIKHERPGQEDRLEKERLAFHQRVYQAYLALAEQEPNRFVKIDASQSPAQVVQACLQVLKNRLPQLFAED